MTNHVWTDFAVGQRVQAHPATDTWMMGDRYGTVEHISKGPKHLIYVTMDVSKRRKRFIASNLLPVE